MPVIRILVVDDSAVIRKALTLALASDPSIEVGGTAPDGRIALSKIAQLNPDLVTLDIEMPGLGGLETLIELRKEWPYLPVIMFSTLTERGAAKTLEALSLGASDYLTKPSNAGNFESTLARVRDELIPKVKALCAARAKGVLSEGLSKRKQAAVSASVVLKQPRLASRVEVLAIGTSTGGPNALAEIIPAMPADFPVPIVIVQHMPPLFTRLLAERLNKQVALKIHEGQAGAALQPGHAWIAPGDYHMTVERNGPRIQLSLNQNAPENSCRPAVDALFRSVAQVFGPSTLAVVLTGMGSDGVLGAQTVRESGGQVFVQDEASSVVWGMPGQVIAAGHADSIVPLRDIAQEIERRVSVNRQTKASSPKVTTQSSSGTTEAIE